MTRVAAVDIGTNSTRLLIADVATDGTLRTVDRRLTITRLGQGVDGSGRLAPEAIDRVLTAVRGYAAAWQAAGATTVGIIATSATRDAANGTDLTDALRDIAGVAPRVLTGEEEAALSFQGATAWLDGDAPVAVVDIGGGSTEVIVGDTRPTASTSRQIGSVRLTERILTDEPPTAAQVRDARATVDVELDAIVSDVDPGRASQLVAVAGTATTLAAIHAGLATYTDGAVHGTTLTADELSVLTERLLAMTPDEVAALGPVQPGREDVLAAGALILDRLVRRIGVDAVLVSEHDILDGLAMELGMARGGAAGELAAAEMVEIVDRDGAVMEVVSRREMRRRPRVRHRCTYVVVVRTEGRVVVHQRAAWKDVSPSAWDLAFGGVCGVGEGWAQSAARELEEEAGVAGVPLTDLGSVEWADAGSALLGRVFVAVHDGPLAPADGEVVALDEVPLSELDAWMAGRDLVDDTPSVVLGPLRAWWASTRPGG